MSEERQSDLGAYNLRSKKKLVDSPAVIVVGVSQNQQLRKTYL